MSCTKGLELPDVCWDVSGGPYIMEGTSADTDFVAAANAEVWHNNRKIKTYTVGDGITLSNNGADPNRKITVEIDSVESTVKGYIFLYVRPTADTTDLISQKIQIVDNHAKRI
jgi:hypothetical protein